jgi:hypothetical protein
VLLQTTELNLRFADAKKAVTQYSKTPAVDPAQISDLAAHDRANKDLLAKAASLVPTE